MWASLYTKDQIEAVLRSHNCGPTTAPRKGTTTVIAHPGRDGGSITRISWSDQKSTYGKRLYKIEVLTADEVRAEVKNEQSRTARAGEKDRS